MSYVLNTGGASETTVGLMSSKITVCDTTNVVVISSALPANAAQESGGNLAAMASGDRARNAFELDQIQITQNIGGYGAGNGFLPIEVPEFYAGG